MAAHSGGREGTKWKRYEKSAFEHSSSSGLSMKPSKKSIFMIKTRNWINKRTTPQIKMKETNLYLAGDITTQRETISNDIKAW